MILRFRTQLILASLASLTFQSQVSYAERTIAGTIADNYTSNVAITHADYTGATYLKVGNNVSVTTTGSGYGGGIGNAAGFYVSYMGSIVAGNNLTIKTSGIHADGIRTNPSNRDSSAADAWYKSQGEIKVGDNLKITVGGGSADCINLNGFSTLSIGDDATLINEYAGATYGEGLLKEGAHGIRANHGSSITLGKNAYVSTAGESSHAVYLNTLIKGTPPAGIVSEGGNVTLGNNATLITTNKSSYAIFAQTAKGKVNLLGTSKMNTKGSSSHAIYVTGKESQLTFADTTEISTEGTGSHGLYVTAANAAITFNAKADISTANTKSHGIYQTSTTGQVSLNKGADIQTKENESHALYAAGGNISTGGATSLTTTGDKAYGIYIYNAGTVSLGAATQITTSGAEAHAISAYYKGAATFNSSTDLLPTTILVQGEGSAVLHATAASSSYAASLTLAGSATLNMNMTPNENTWGAKAEKFGTINFTETSSTGGTALYADGSATSTYGTIALKDSADAAGSHVQLKGYGVLDTTQATDSVSIGSLASEDATTEVRFGSKTLSVGAQNSANNGSRIESTLYAGKLVGETGSSFEKTGDGTVLTLTGLNSTVDNVNVRGGTLAFHQDGKFHVNGNFTTYGGGTTRVGEEGSHLVIDGLLTQKADSRLVVTLGAEADVRAKSAELDGYIVINGFDQVNDIPVRASDATQTFYTVISTEDGISGDFLNNPLLTIGLDYLLHHGYVTNDGKDYVLGFELSWTRGCKEKGTGSFTLAEGTAFDIDIDLTDQTPNVNYQHWDGKTLTKKGAGLLLISSDSTYTGDSHVEEGTLQVTGSIVSHVVNSSIVDAPGTIGSLHNYENAVARIGKVNGDVHNAGTVYLNQDIASWGDLHNTGLLDFVNVGRELTVQNFSGSGTIRADVDLTTGNADRIIAEGDISGSQNFIFANVGTGEVVFTERIEQIVTVLGDVALDTNLTGTLTEGVYKYTLLQQEDKTWDLVRSTDYNDETQAIVNTVGALALSWFSQLDNITKRMGDLRMGLRNTKDIWVRGYGQQINGKLDIAGIGGLREYQWGTDLGYDHTWYPNEENMWALGGFFGYQGAHRKFRDTYNSSGDTHSGYVGGYGTWMHKEGWYSDFVLKGQYFDNKYKTTSGTGNFNNYALGASAEFGRQIMNEKGWFVEPSVQIAYTHIFGDKHYSPDDLHVRLGGADIFRFVAMTRAGKTYTLSPTAALQPYIKAGAEEQVSKGGSVRVAGQGFRPDTDGTRGILGAGIIWQIDDRSQIHLDYEASFGDKYTKPWGVNLGYRYQF